MREPDLVPLVARCFQNFMDVENHDPNTCYVPPSLETLDERAKQSYLNDALFHRKVDTIVYVVSEHITALRSQVAELQRQLDAEQQAHAATIQREAKLSLQLDEATGQEPVAFANKLDLVRFADRKGRDVGAFVSSMKSPLVSIALYRLPPNLPALIEQAKTEEAERCASIAMEMFHAAAQGDEIADAIRARKP